MTKNMIALTNYKVSNCFQLLKVTVSDRHELSYPELELS